MAKKIFICGGRLRRRGRSHRRRILRPVRRSPAEAEAPTPWLDLDAE